MGAAIAPRSMRSASSGWHTWSETPTGHRLPRSKLARAAAWLRERRPPWVSSMRAGRTDAPPGHRPCVLAMGRLRCGQTVRLKPQALRPCAFSLKPSPFSLTPDAVSLHPCLRRSRKTLSLSPCAPHGLDRFVVVLRELVGWLAAIGWRGLPQPPGRSGSCVLFPARSRFMPSRSGPATICRATWRAQRSLISPPGVSATRGPSVWAGLADTRLPGVYFRWTDCISVLSAARL